MLIVLLCRKPGAIVNSATVRLVRLWYLCYKMLDSCKQHAHRSIALSTQSRETDHPYHAENIAVIIKSLKISNARPSLDAGS